MLWGGYRDMMYGGKRSSNIDSNGNEKGVLEKEDWELGMLFTQ